jgi:hypothetical protein
MPLEALTLTFSPSHGKELQCKCKVCGAICKVLLLLLLLMLIFYTPVYSHVLSSSAGGSQEDLLKIGVMPGDLM